MGEILPFVGGPIEMKDLNQKFHSYHFACFSLIECLEVLLIKV